MVKIGGLIVAIVVAVAIVAFAASSAPSGGFRAWIAEVYDGDGDWGWDQLGAEGQRAYGGDIDAYNAEMAAADWAALILGPPVDAWSDDGFVRVELEVKSGPATVPAFLFERRIVHGVCDGREPRAIGAYDDRRPFGDGMFDGGGLTGGQARCNAAFARSDP